LDFAEAPVYVLPEDVNDEEQPTEHEQKEKNERGHKQLNKNKNLRRKESSSVNREYSRYDDVFSLTENY
jgi:hypothetical protein